MDLGLTQGALGAILLLSGLVGLIWGVVTSGHEFENAYLDREFVMDTATPARRLGGSLIDSILLSVPLGVALAVPALFWLPAIWVIWFAVVARRGQTPGKALVSTYVIRSDGTIARWWYMWYRELAIKGLLFGVLGYFLGRIPGTLGALWCLWDDDKQCLWDKVARTYVAYSPLEPPTARVPAARSATSLGSEELLALQQQRRQGAITAEQYEERRRQLVD